MGASAENAPSGIVTFVFTDIEGSTRLFRRLGPRYVELLERHNELVRSTCAGHGGYVISIEGDSFFVAFGDADDAIRACAAVQRLIAAEPWPEGAQVRIRIGVHSGLASPRGDGYVSLAVHQAARVMAAAHGGQTLVSQETVDRAGPPDALELRLLGRFRLRDFDEPARLYQLAGEALAESFPAIRAMPADGHNIVLESTSTIGRDELIASVAAVIGPGKLVTLYGPGGVGKTRVAKEIGVRVAPDWVDGVWFVDLAGVTESGLVAAAVADAVGAPARPGGERSDDVVEHLRGQRAVIVLDNCEHVLATCAELIVSLEATCPDVGALATSLQPLRVAGEVAWPVAPLVPPTGPQSDAADVLASPAGRLFAERGAAARPGFVIDRDNAGAVGEICRQLDGLPLALELAAAMLAVQSPAEILAGLDDRFRFLRSRDRLTADRHRSLEDLLTWSYECLEDAERVAFRHLSVFAASFSIRTATAAIAGASVAPEDVAELIWSLVDRSLVVADLTANATRYRLLESTHLYGRRLLDESGETVGVATRLAGSLLEGLGPWVPVDRRWVGDVGVELDNLRALVPLVATHQPEQAQELACTIGRYHDASQTYRDGIEEVGGYAEALPVPSSTRVSLLTILADLHLRIGEVDPARWLVEDAEALREKHGAPSWDEVGVDRTRGEVARRSGDLTGAVQIAREGLERPLSDRDRSRMYNLLGTTLTALGDLQAGYIAFAEELELNRSVGYETYVASAQGNLAEVAMRLGDSANAARHQDACLELAVADGSKALIAFSLIMAARLAGEAGAWAAATRLHAQGDALLEELGLALYDDDRLQSDELLAGAREELGDADYARNAAAGRDIDLLEAVALARSLFAKTQRREAG
jgi:predicted ATPase/class 3 adenylate cyclase/tetratricopeptide (TPR) repeat protein